MEFRRRVVFSSFGVFINITMLLPFQFFFGWPDVRVTEWWYLHPQWYSMLQDLKVLWIWVTGPSLRRWSRNNGWPSRGSGAWEPGTNDLTCANKSGGKGSANGFQDQLVASTLICLSMMTMASSRVVDSFEGSAYHHHLVVGEPWNLVAPSLP